MEVTLAMALLVSLVLMMGMVSSDRLYDIKTKMEAVNEDNCATKSRADLTLPVTDYQLGSSLITDAKKLALNRAIFYSLTNQKLNSSDQFFLQPDLYYTYLSTATSLSSSADEIIATGVYYDQNTYYANFYYNLYFNMTLKLFAPYALRDPDGSKVTDDSLRNYTRDVFSFKTGEWFSQWLPDRGPRNDGSHFKDVLTTVDSQQNTQQSVFVVAGEDQVKVTEPYFDCGRSNKWIVTVSSPVVDYLPRYTPWSYLRRPRYVAVSTVDVEYVHLDINQCDGDNTSIFSGTHKCKPSTECRPIRGPGMARGGYSCVCRPGYKNPDPDNHRPFMGWRIEMASESEYSAGFECVQSDSSSSEEPSSYNTPSWVPSNLVQTVLSASPSDCTSGAPPIVLPTKPYLYIRDHLVSQMRQGYRLAQLVSGLLQQLPFSPGDNFLVKAPQDVNTHQLAAEVEAIVFSDDQIAAVEMVLEKEDGQIFSYLARKSSASNLRLNVKQDYWTSAMWDERTTQVWTGGHPGNNITVLPSMKPVANAGVVEDMLPWSFLGPDDVQIEKPEYSCLVNAWVEKISSAIKGPGSQSNIAVRSVKTKRIPDEGTLIIGLDPTSATSPYGEEDVKPQSNNNMRSAAFDTCHDGKSCP